MLNYERAGLRLLYIFLLILLISSWLQALEFNGSKVLHIGEPVIILDPGHGGTETGAKGKYSLEKDINLIMAQRLKSLILYHIPDAIVLLTREDDRNLCLKDRAQLANRNNADLFISLHCNSNTTGTVRGAEVYIMGSHKAEDHFEITQRENQEDHNHVDNNLSIDESNLDFIFLNQVQSTVLNRSYSVGQACVEELAKAHPASCRPLRQAGFMVLWNASMPSMLVEMAYINNSKDEALLNSQEGQVMITMAILESIKKFLQNKQLELESASIPISKNE